MIEGQNQVIAVDADGVLLDYNAAYADAWEKAFGVRPALRNANAYWPFDRWAVNRLAVADRARLRGQFDERFWATIPALPGALDACMRLVSAGFELICVTAVRPDFAVARRRNLQELGFPLRDVIATGNSGASTSPKASAIKALAPVAFVDDYLPYHRGVPGSVHKALVLREPEGSPNVGDELDIVDSQHVDLASFATWWLSRR